MYVPYNYIKLYSSNNQSKQTWNIIMEYANKNNIITDATAGVGGNSFYFSNFTSVNCVEINNLAFEILRKNMKSFNNIYFYNDDFLKIYKNLKQDIIFLDPPWGKNYKNQLNNKLYLNNIPIKNIIEELYNYTELVILKSPMKAEFIPKNWNFTTHYIYKKRDVIYKIIVFHK